MPIALDYTSRIAPAALRAADVRMVCRYLSYLPGSAWKVIRQPEYDELVNAGIGVTLNWEYQATDWMTGAIGGSGHALEAIRQAQALGYPAGRVIVGSADFDMTRKQWDGPCKSYAAAFAAGIRHGGYRPGVYGPSDVLDWVRDAGIMDAFWQAGMSTAWSGGRNRTVWNGAHIRQRGHKIVGGVDTDWNEILITPLWGVKAAPIPEEDEMYLINILASGTGTPPKNFNYINVGGTWTYVRTIEALAWLKGQSILAVKDLGSMWDWEAVDRFGFDRNATPTNANTPDITQEMLNAAVNANVEQIATALATHIKIT